MLPEVGLVVGVYDLSAERFGLMRSGDQGRCLYKVLAKLIVFRPFVNEILTGTIKASDCSGISVSLGFFQDVKIPQEYLREPKQFDASENLWCWTYEDSNLFYHCGETVRLRVQDVKFREMQGPEKHRLPSLLKDQEQHHNDHDGNDDHDDDNYVVPMAVIGRVDTDGLGMTAWWD